MFLLDLPECNIIDMGVLSETFEIYVRKHKEDAKHLEQIIE